MYRLLISMRSLVAAGNTLQVDRHLSLAWRKAGGLTATMSKNSWLSLALGKVQNRFLLVNLLTKRIRQLKDGAPSLIQGGNNLAVEEIALQEIAEGKITPTSMLDT
jgi:DNA-directed RNA polymerase omega subunit